MNIWLIPIFWSFAIVNCTKFCLIFVVKCVEFPQYLENPVLKLVILAKIPVKLVEYPNFSGLFLTDFS